MMVIAKVILHQFFITLKPPVVARPEVDPGLLPRIASLTTKAFPVAPQASSIKAEVRGHRVSSSVASCKAASTLANMSCESMRSLERLPAAADRGMGGCQRRRHLREVSHRPEPGIRLSSTGRGGCQTAQSTPHRTANSGRWPCSGNGSNDRRGYIRTHDIWKACNPITGLRSCRSAEAATARPVSGWRESDSGPLCSPLSDERVKRFRRVADRKRRPDALLCRVFKEAGIQGMVLEDESAASVASGQRKALVFSPSGLRNVPPFVSTA